MNVIYLISPEDERRRCRISSKTEHLAKAAYKTLNGVNIRVPERYRWGLSMRPDQEIYHYDPRAHESIKTLWDIITDLHRLSCGTHHITNPTVRRELQDDINILLIGILRLLHWS